MNEVDIAADVEQALSETEWKLKKVDVGPNWWNAIMGRPILTSDFVPHVVDSIYLHIEFMHPKILTMSCSILVN